MHTDMTEKNVGSPPKKSFGSQQRLTAEQIFITQEFWNITYSTITWHKNNLVSMTIVRQLTPKSNPQKQAAILTPCYMLPELKLKPG
jgi:hypothetical protein